MELLLRDVKVFVDRYSAEADSSDPHLDEHWNPTKDRYLRNHLQLGWEKLDKYYRLTDDSSAYVAAIALHPRFKWRWIEKKWSDRADWQTVADEAIRKQWATYKAKKIDDLLGPKEVEEYRLQKQKRTETPQLEYFMEEDFQTSSDEDGQSQINEYMEWQKIGREKHIDNSVAYWYKRRLVWPHLARFALDLFSIPAMSAEAERVFSSTGRMVRPDRGCLKSDVIGAAACLRQWDRSGVINWVS